jgi:hypothetical protein
MVNPGPVSGVNNNPSCSESASNVTFTRSKQTDNGVDFDIILPKELRPKTPADAVPQANGLKAGTDAIIAAKYDDKNNVIGYSINIPNGKLGDKQTAGTLSVIKQMALQSLQAGCEEDKNKPVDKPVEVVLAKLAEPLKSKSRHTGEVHDRSAVARRTDGSDNQIWH